MFIISKIVRGRRLLHEFHEDDATRPARTNHDDLGGSLSRSDQSRRSGKANTSKRASQCAADQASVSSSNGSVRQRRRQLCCKADSIFRDEERAYSNRMSEPIGLRRSSSMPSICGQDSLNQLEGRKDVSMRHYDYDSKLNRLQKKSLRFTWNRLLTRNGGKRIEVVFEEVYDRLLRNQPTLREIFTTRTFLSAMSKSNLATPREHAKETVRMFDSAIRNLDNIDENRNDTGSSCDPFLIGKIHCYLRPYGLTANYWEKLGEIMIDVLLAQEAVRDLPGAGQAWVVLLACIIDQLLSSTPKKRRPPSSA